MKKLFFVPVLLAFFMLTFVACDQKQQATEQAIDTNEERFDDNENDMDDIAESVAKAYENNDKLLQASEIAMQNEGQLDEQTLSFVRTLQEDQQNLRNELDNLANQNNIQLPQNINYDENSEIGKLRQASGDEFKDNFWSVVDDAHSNLKDNMEEISDEAEKENNPEFKNFAEQKKTELEAMSETLDQLKNEGNSQDM